MEIIAETLLWNITKLLSSDLSVSNTSAIGSQQLPVLIISITNSSTESSFFPASISAIPHIVSIQSSKVVRGLSWLATHFTWDFSTTLNWKTNWSSDPVTVNETISKAGQESDELWRCIWINLNLSLTDKSLKFNIVSHNTGAPLSSILQPMLGWGESELGP